MDDGGNTCSTWFDSRTALLNSSSPAVSHSSSNVGVSGEQYPRRRARSITELMRWRSDALVKPRHALAAYVCSVSLIRITNALNTRFTNFTNWPFCKIGRVRFWRFITMENYSFDSGSNLNVTSWTRVRPLLTCHYVPRRIQQKKCPDYRSEIRLEARIRSHNV